MIKPTCKLSNMGAISRCWSVVHWKSGIKFRAYMGTCELNVLLLKLSISWAFYPLNDICLFSFTVFLVRH